MEESHRVQGRSYKELETASKEWEIRENKNQHRKKISHVISRLRDPFKWLSYETYTFISPKRNESSLLAKKLSTN